MKRRAGIPPACLNALGGSPRSEVVSVANFFTHEQIKELAPREAVTEMFTEHGRAAALSSGKVCSGANAWPWVCNLSLADSGYAKPAVFH